MRATLLDPVSILIFPYSIPSIIEVKIKSFSLVALGGHALLRAFVVVFRAVRGFFRDAAAVFLALGAASTAGGNSNFGCFAIL